MLRIDQHFSFTKRHQLSLEWNPYILKCFYFALKLFHEANILLEYCSSSKYFSLTLKRSSRLTCTLPPPPPPLLIIKMSKNIANLGILSKQKKIEKTREKKTRPDSITVYKTVSVPSSFLWIQNKMLWTLIDWSDATTGFDTHHNYHQVSIIRHSKIYFNRLKGI